MIHVVIRAGVLASTAPTIVLLAAVLVVFGIALLVVGVRLLRRTRSDPAALGPLEEMGERGWQSADEVHRGELLDRARPAGAEPIAVAAVAASEAEAAAEEPVAETAAAEPEEVVAVAPAGSPADVATPEPAPADESLVGA